MALSTTQYGYIIDPMVPFTDDKGKTIKDGFVRVFVAGSSTPVVTYRNFDGATNQVLIELDNSGRTRTSVIGSKGFTYKVCVYDAFHSQESPILTVDKVSVIGANITAGAGATLVTGLDGLTTKPDGFVDASVVGTDGYVALDHTLVTDDLDTDAKVTAVEEDRYIPLLNEDVNDPDSKMTLGRLWKWVLGKIKSLPTTITAFRTGDVIPVDGPSGTAKMAAEQIATKENVIASQSHVVDLNDASYWQNGGLKSSNGKEFDAVDRLRTIFLKLTENGTMSYTAQTGVSFTWTFFCYNANKEFLGNASNFSIADLITTYPTAVWFRLTLNSITGITPDASHIEDVASFGGSLREYDVVRESQLEQVYTELETLDEKIDHVFDDGKTALDMNDTAYWQNGGIDSSSGTETGAADRLRTVFLRFTSDSNISYSKKSGVNFSRALYCYDENKVYLGYSGSTSIATAIGSFPTAVWFRISLTGITGATVDYTNIANIFNWQSGLYEVVDGYATRLGNLEKLTGGFVYKDPLKGKKWYACGDSFTAGATNNTITKDGPYKGYKCVYPYFIGNRTAMDVHNIAVSGSTMTYKSGTSTASNCFSYPSTGKYLSIPADADYITLKFGINDDPSHQDMPLGTISDNTNETLYGAWNVVISYLVANCPHAKIGIIVSNGCYDSDYSKAARDIAEKWGLGYLDENFDYKVPLLIRVTGKPDVSSAAHNAVLLKMRVSESNTHPNDWAHEYESTIVEAWLRTL